jgi:hypothetical protein
MLAVLQLLQLSGSASKQVVASARANEAVGSSMGAGTSARTVLLLPVRI